MLKFIVLGVLFYYAYKLFFAPQIEAPKNQEPPDEYVDYEEID